MNVARDGLVPDWPAPPGVRALCTTRSGGTSRGPYESFNLGAHVGDDAPAVAANRSALAQAVGVRPVFLDQVHGVGVARLDATTPDGMHADGCVATLPGIACTIMVADCLPILFTDGEGRAVAAAHAGWRGLAAGIIERTHAALLAAISEEKTAAQRASTHSSAIKVIAWMGPCIGPGAFEVGDEVREAFGAPALFKPKSPGKWLADLPGLARSRLRALGVASIHGNDGSDAWCTVAHPERFFSHRRDKVSGRMATCIWKA